MLRFRDLPIRQKLMAFIMLVSSLALLAAILAVAAFEKSAFKPRAVRDLRSRAELIASSAQAALEFDDRKVAGELLHTLDSSPEVLSGCIYNSKGMIFASYVSPESPEAHFPAPEADGYHFENQHLRLFQSIYSKGERVGTVYLDYSLRLASGVLRSQLILASIIIIALMALAFILSTVLQRTISKPVMRLAAAAQAITSKGDYAVRVPKDTNDEIGQLTDAFNEMLTIIAARRNALNQANHDLACELAERKQAEAALQRSQAELKELNLGLEKRVNERTATLRETIGELQHISYSLTHDMRAPLRAMHGFAQLLLTESEGRLQPEQEQYLRKILVSATRLDRLIRDALDYTRVAGAPVRLETVDIAALLEGMLQSYPHLQPPNADIRIEGKLPAVLGNEALLTQCFSNLLSNAAKFVRPKTTPRVRLRSETASSSSVRIWIEDNGIGIPKEARSRIFGMFERAHTGYDGTGIGLAIVRKAVERMGGKVGVESEPGQGSRFWVELRSVKVQSPAPEIKPVTV